MEGKDKCGAANTRGPLSELDKKHFNMLRIILCMKQQRKLTFVLRTDRQTYCDMCRTVHDEVHTFHNYYN